MTTPSDAMRHREVTDAVHRHEGAKIAMQILHAGRYGYHPFNVAPTKAKAPIGWFTPKALTATGVEQTIDDFVRCAALAEEAGYDGVEVMGSEGYLINQFLVERVNSRTDEWGGSFENRMRLPLRIVEGIRAVTSPDFLIVFRLSMLDLVERGSSWEEVLLLAQALEAAGVSIINTGIGWHEARIPTIATKVPRAGFSWVTAKLKGSVSVPLVATNRINSAAVAEQVLADGHADMVSMARPFLADPFLLSKAAEGREDEVNTCIACNQACLDHTFAKRRASCLVNPRAGYEAELSFEPTQAPLRLAVVGAGPAGLAFATTAARRGHAVTLYEASEKLGGQFNLAKQVPGKEEFHETIRYFTTELRLSGVDVRLGTRAAPAELAGGQYDKVVLATGVSPRPLGIPGADHPRVISYIDALTRAKPVGRSVAVVGAGGIGFDVAEFLAHEADAHPADELVAARPPAVRDFLAQHGIDPSNEARGGLLPPAASGGEGGGGGAREIYLLQRKKGKHGGGLGKTTGWIHRASLKAKGVHMLGGVKYEQVDERGLHLTLKDGSPKLLEVDTVVVCAGQTSRFDLEAPLLAAAMPTFRIGGAHVASELDAKRAIDQASRLAAAIETAEPDKVGEFVAPLGFDGWLFDKLTARRASA